jgi:hypothetical protein
VPDCHADPVSGLQFVNAFEGHTPPSAPMKPRLPPPCC